jgi:4-hydroxybenzoate polyprenyltransferase
MNAAAALVKAMRPQQWTKNLFVLAPVLFEGRFHLSGKNARALAVFGIFCLLASAVYLFNDVMDRHADRLHPRKRHRPVASGALSVPAALVASAVLLAAGFSWAWFGLWDTWVVGICAAYVVIQLAYGAALKHVVLLDVLCIASGFVLRLLAGSTASWIEPSKWILVCTIFLSLFLALCKRRHEVTTLGEDASQHRPALESYTVPFLDQLIGIAAGASIVTYALWTVDPSTTERHALSVGGHAAPVLAATIPCVVYGLFRYLFLVHRRDGGGSPSTTLVRDLPSLVNGVVYAALTASLILFFRA